jgi:phosphatidylserine/phosphatidylglycerophosphate/cardiolipin synthase-like enzyme
MGKLLKAQAFCNSEIAFLAWSADGPIDGCLGFMVTRVHLDANGMEIERRVLPTWVAFNTQSNPDWEEQDASVWPIQKFSWRDLTLRRSRDKLAIRPLEFSVKYEIAPVGLAGAGRAAVPLSPTAQPGKYKGTPIPLYFCGTAKETNTITVTQRFGDVAAGFTNGILSTQNLRKQLKTPAGRAPTKGEVDVHISKPGDAIREYLAGDVLPMLRLLFQRAADVNGKIYLALYELADEELVDLLLQNEARLELILTTAGSTKPKKGSGDPVEWDITNKDARTKLAKVMGGRLHNRWFNNSAHIGHNKFAILESNQGVPEVVWTGSTNWTNTGLCGQTNNTIIVNSRSVASAYKHYWDELLKDKLPVPNPQSAGLASNQGAALRSDNAKAVDLVLDGSKTTGSIWFSPNTEKVGSSKTRTVPADLAEVFQLMKKANHAIFFLVFNPGRTSDAEDADINTVVAAGIDFGRLDPKLLVTGAISDPTAVPGYTAPPKGAPKSKVKVPQIAIFRPDGAENVLVIRAAAIKDLIGDFDKELLTAGQAIIHDKIVVIDPMSETDCVVITGSHNLGFKASYANDENMLIIRGNRPLALAYAAHVLDVCEHYKFRAALEQQVRDALLAGKKKPERAVGKGFLNTHPSWQDPYFSGDKGRDGTYFLSSAL